MRKNIRVLQLALLAPLGMNSLIADEIGYNTNEQVNIEAAISYADVSQGESNDQCPCCPAITCQGNPFEPCELPAGYGQYAGVALDRCIDIFVSGDFLYWKPVRRNSVDICQFENDPSNTILMIQEKGEYRPGFKVGIGATLPNFDDWTLRADYTWYHHDFTHTFTAPATQVVSPFAVPLLLVPFTSIKSTMTFDYDDLKLTIHRPVYVGPRLVLDPYFGLRGIWRSTKLSQALTLPPPLIQPGVIGQNFQQAKVRMWYACMTAGGYGSFLFGCGFKLLFKGEASLGYCRLTENSSRVVNNSTIPFGVNVITQGYSKDPYCIQGMGTGGGGLGWASYFCCQKYHLDLSIMYELESIWGPFLDYNTVLFLTDTQFRGLTVHAQFDF